MKKMFFILCLPVFTGIYVSAQTITTVAGIGVSSFGGDNGLATRAGIANPLGVCFDKEGNLYIADNDIYRVRKVSTSGIISTIAGNGVSGYSGNGGPATAAELLYPQGIAVDDSGNVYDSEWGNNVIHKTSVSSGIITVYAGNISNGWSYSGDGGPATDAGLSNPAGMRFDANNNLYFSDNENNVARMVTASTGIITTVAGNNAYGAGYSGDGGPATAAEVNDSRGIGIDTVGNIYIADCSNNVIRKVTVSTGIITTVVGNYNYGGGYSGDGGPATLAELNYPTDIILDAFGNMYITDLNNGVIRKVNSSGIISTVAGDEALSGNYNGDSIPAVSAALNAPFGIAMFGTGIYFADEYNNRVRKVDSLIKVPAGIEHVSGNVGADLFPNPNMGIFTIRLSGNSGRLIVEIWTAIGTQVYVPAPKQANYDITIDISSQPDGIYFLRLLDKNGSIVTQKKFIKTK